MAPMKTQILCKKLIKPSTPTPRHLRPVKLSLMDQLIPPTDINMIFYYSPNDEDKIAKSKERCSQLEKSLAEALTKFYPLAGRLVMDDLLIDCNDKGIEFLKAQSNGNLADFLHGGPHAERLDQLVPGDGGVGDSATAPLAAIQLNVFDCGGVVVGVSISHKVADAFSIIKFVNGWATANRDGIKGVICPNFNLGSIFPVSDLLPPNPPPSTKKGVKIVTRRLFFGSVAIKTLVAVAGGSAPRPPTGVEVVAALIWKALIGIAQVKHGHLRASLLVHPLNLRGHTAISIPDNSFGNFSMLFIERLVEERKLEFHELVSLLGNSKRDVNPGKTGTVDDLCSMVNGSFREARREKLHNHRVDVHLCASWCGLPLYEADFGWGKPIWVSSSSKYEVVKLIENKCGDGIDAWVSLNEKDMLEFERDLDILAFTSQ
ncbi:Acetyl-CoA-benzylalcohol acetyltransferase [Actinidia chinensis var. chinensis]|uniref:Acetyl-CoA-benzylalcohol acetyltransferase n=1 Tax=Actinidia chinensis var. chinensis TaxID=1590841 RepID=A0A2R6RGT5_ACTCC|nr:Acetyl-CoA-benzylalcohol acetyltransferase [Actinidia chinensis var. chinensis]